MKPWIVGGLSHGSSGPGLTTRRRCGEPVGEDLVEDRVPDPGRACRRSSTGHSILGPDACVTPRVPPEPVALPLAVVTLIVASCGGPSVTDRPRQPPAAATSAVGPERVGDCRAARRPARTGRQLAATPPWWHDRVFYEVFVRSFADSDGDGIGDLRGLTERLDYLNDGDPATTDDLGVTALWLMPVAESPSYHGYDVTDYETIERDYGTAEDFHALMAAAHERGIAGHRRPRAQPHVASTIPGSRTRRRRAPSTTTGTSGRRPASAFAGPGGRRVWHQDGDRFYYGHFWEGMPDLNLANPDVTDGARRDRPLLAERRWASTASGSTPRGT